MLDHLEESTRVLDLRGVFLASSAYAAAAALTLELERSGALVVAVYVIAAGVFARRGGRRWCAPAALHSALAAAGGIAWSTAEAWARDAYRRALEPEPAGMRFSIADSCFDPSPGEVAFQFVLVLLVIGAASVPVGWAARWLFPMQQEGGWPGPGGWYARASWPRRAAGTTPTRAPALRPSSPSLRR